MGRGDNEGTGVLFVETPKDVEKTYPYLFSDLKQILMERYEASVFPTKGAFQTYNAKCITFVNRLNDNNAYIHKTKKTVIWRYSELHLSYVTSKMDKNDKYLFEMRARKKLIDSKSRG